MREKIIISILLSIGLLLVLSSCDIPWRECFSGHTVSRKLKKTDVSDGSNYSFDLQSLFQEKIDSVFYFNGPRFSDEISSIIGYPGGECGATSTLQDTQSRIIIFSDGQISYFENFRITFCFMDSDKIECARFNTIVDVNKYDKNEYRINPR